MKYLYLALVALVSSTVVAQDIAVSAANFSSEQQRYQAFNADITLHSATAINQFVLTVLYFSKDSVIDTSDRQGAFAALNSIEANTSKSLAVSGSFNQFGIDLEPGNYFVIIKADSRNDISETDESNNIAVIPVHIKPALVDLVFANPSVKQRNINQSGVMDVSYDIKNLNVDNVQSVEATFYLSAAGVDGEHLLEWQYQYNGLNWKQVGTFNQTLSVPADFPRASYELFGRIENFGQEIKIEETNTANNTMSFGLINVVGSDVDLSLDRLWVTDLNELMFDYTLQITNHGSTGIQGYSLKFIFSKDDVLDDSDVFSVTVPFHDHFSQRIDAHQTLEQFEVYGEPYGHDYLPVGSWYIIAQINDDRQVAETDYANNQVVSQVPLVVAPFKIKFEKNPTVSNITETSLAINVSYEYQAEYVYYLVQKDGLPAPDATLMKSQLYVDPTQSTITTRTINDLLPGTNYDVYLMQEFDNGVVTEIYKIDVTTLSDIPPSVPDPTITISTSSLLFGPMDLDVVATPQTYWVGGKDISGAVKLYASEHFLISTHDGDYTSSLSFDSPLLFSNGSTQKIFVKFDSPHQVDNFTGSIVHISAGADTTVLLVNAICFASIDEDFDGLDSLDESGWHAFNRLGKHIWRLKNGKSLNGRVKDLDQVVQINGTENGVAANEDWLISPALNLSDFVNTPEASFYSKTAGNGQLLELKYSLNYSQGDPSTATWTNIDGQFPLANTDAWKKSSHIALPKKANVHVAFVYRSTGTDASTWSIDNWHVADNLISIATDHYDFGAIEVGSISPAKNFSVHAIGYGDIKVEASVPFKVSLDNTTFTSELTVLASNAGAGAVVYVLFAPTTPGSEISGSLIFSGDNYSDTQNILSGSTPSPTPTGAEQDASSRITIYPNPTSHDVHVDFDDNIFRGAVSVTIINNLGIVTTRLSYASGALSDGIGAAIENLPAGLYSIQFENQGNRFVERIVKQ